MSGVYQVTPRADSAFRLGELDPPRRFVAPADGNWPAGIPGTAGEPYYERPAGYWKGAVDWETITEPKFGHNAAQSNNTDGLIDPDTNVVKTHLPPNSRSFILGPLVDGFVPNHIGDAFTRIGYIEKDTRQFVLLGIIQGEWIAGLNEVVAGFGGGSYPVWDGNALRFTQVNPNFTLDMALWFRNEMLKGRFVKNVSYNAVGGIAQLGNPDPNAPQPLGGNGVGGGSGNAAENPDGTGAGVGSGGNPTTGTEQGDPDDNDIESLELWGINYNQQNPKPKPEDYPNVRSYRRALAKWNREKRAAEQEFKNQQNQNTGPILPPDPSGDPQTEQNFFSNLKSKVSQAIKVVDTTLDYTEKILASFKNKLPQKNIADFITDAVMGANSGSAYNTQLAASLFNNVITGQNTRIKIGAEGRNSMVNSLDAAALEKALVLGPPPEPSADNAIRPGKKVDGVLKGRWGDQGGSEFHYNPENGTFTITSVKMLRQFEGDKKFGPGTNFEDIPDQTGESVSNLIDKIPGAKKTLRTFFNVLAVGAGDDFRTSLAGQEVSNKDNETLAGKLFGNKEENKIIVDKLMQEYPKQIAAMTNFLIEGSASNAVLLRQALTSLGLPKTQAEKEGAGYGGYTYSQEVFTGSELPKEVRQAIINKYTSVDSAWSNVKAESYTGDKKRILREIRQPLKEIKELPKTQKLKGYRPNFKGKYSPQNTPDVTASKRSDQLVMAKNAEGQAWTVGDKYQKGWETTGRMNHVYARVGESNKYFEEITSNNSADVDRKMQEHLNHVYHNKAMLKIDSNYKSPFIGNDIDESETYDNKVNDPLFTKVAKRLKKEIDYPKKPAAKGYPNEAPPKIDPNSGYHPKFGKRYKYDKLDPISAKTMAGAPTGDPEIDANVKKAAKVKEDWRSDLKNLWLGAEREDWKKKLEEGMNTSDTFSYSKAGRGDTDLITTGTGYTEDGIHQLQNIPPMETVDDPHLVGKALGGGPIGKGYQNVYGGINQYDGPSQEAAGQENTYWNNAVDGSRLDDNDNPRFSDYIYPFDRPATGAEIQTAMDASQVRGRGDVFRATYPTNVFGDRHKATPVATNPTVGVDDDYNTVGLGVQFGASGDTRSPRFFVPAGVNTSEIDTVKILASVGGNANTMTQAGSQIQLFYWAGDKPGFQSLQDKFVHPASDYPNSNRQYDGWRPIAQKPNGEIDNSVISNIIDLTGDLPLGFTRGKVSEFSLQIPEWCRTINTRFMFIQMSSGNGGATIYSIRYQRRNAITINTTLADEKASAFVRVGNNSQMSPEERKKKLNDMLKASREYMIKSLGFASLFNDEVKISDVVSSNLDFMSVMQGDGKYGNARFHDIIDADKVRAAARKASKRSSPKKFRGYKRTGRDSKGMTTRARVNPKDIIGSI